MLKKLVYELEVAILDFVRVEIWVEDNNLLFSKKTLTNPLENIDNEISTVSAEVFSNKVDALHLSNWKKHYEPQGYVVMDGESWTVEYENMDGTKIKRSGDNAYPSNWKAFQKLLSDVAGNVNLD